MILPILHCFFYLILVNLGCVLLIEKRKSQNVIIKSLQKELKVLSTQNPLRLLTQRKTENA